MPGLQSAHPPPRRTHRRTRRRLIAGLTVSLGVVPGPLPAQAVFTGNWQWESLHVWRGTVRANRPVFAADLAGTWSLGSISADVWDIRNIELTAGAIALYQVGGADLLRFGDRSTSGVSEINPWLQLAAGFGAVDAAVGVTRYFYRGDGGPARSRTPDDDVTEMFTSLTIPGKRLTMRGRLWLELGEVGGGYFETEAQLHLPFVPLPVPPIDPLFGTLQIRLVAGWSAGQTATPAGPGYFASEGLTHAALIVASGLLVARTISIDPSITVQVSRDAQTRLFAPGQQREVFVRFGLAVRPVALLTLGGN